MGQDLCGAIELFHELDPVRMVVPGLHDRPNLIPRSAVRMMVRGEARRQRAEERDESEGRDGT